MSARALIVDDHPIIRDALVSSLISLDVFEEVDTARSFREMLDKLQRDASYQLLILDLSLTDISGSDGMVYVREHYADIPVIVFSANDSVDIIAQCFERGVQGFVSKNTPMQIFVSAIQVVLAGGIYIPPSAAGVLEAEALDPGESGAARDEKHTPLTPKQYEVLEQLMKGVPNKIIAERLELAEGTVKAHLYSIYKLLGVNSRAQAILKAQRMGIAS